MKLTNHHETFGHNVAAAAAPDTSVPSPACCHSPCSDSSICIIVVSLSLVVVAVASSLGCAVLVGGIVETLGRAEALGQAETLGCWLTLGGPLGTAETLGS